MQKLYYTVFIMKIGMACLMIFPTRQKRLAEEEIHAALEIFQEVGIKSNVFVPPQWKLCRGCIEVLGKLGFGLAEMQEEFFLLSHDPVRKIKVPKVLSWDLTDIHSKIL